MAFDLGLAARIREVLNATPGVLEHKMFGGLAFLIRDNMAVVVSSRGGMMIRADPVMTKHLVETTRAEFAEMRGREMRGWIYLDAVDVRCDDELTVWIDLAIGYSSTLTPKRWRDDGPVVT